MPGITGFITQTPSQNCDRDLHRMVQTMCHESFYRHGFISKPDQCAYVGWTCHENAFNDCMPILNEKKDVALFLAGEIVLDPDAINDLRKSQHDFDGLNASYIVHLYEEKGIRFIDQIDGFFSGVVIDERLQKVFLFNDRFGMHRLFTHSGRNGFYFSSEAKALLAIIPESRAFDPKGVAEFVTCGCTLGENSLFNKINVLPGATLFEFDHGKITKKHKYFDCQTWEDQAKASEESFTQAFHTILPQIAHKYVPTRTPAAMSLTGGFDSRMLIASLNPPPNHLPCYTFGSNYRDTFDVKVARKVARACGQEHHTLVVGEHFLQNMPAYLERAVFLSDGYIGLSGAAELYANELARPIAPARLTGNWGSELLRGVRAFKFSAPKNSFLHPDLNNYVEEARHFFEEKSSTPNLSFSAFFQAPHQSFGRLAIERSQIIPLTPFMSNDILACIYQKPAGLDGFAASKAVIGKFRPDLLTIPTDRGYLGTDGKLFESFRRIVNESLFKAEYLMSHGATELIVRNRDLQIF